MSNLFGTGINQVPTNGMLGNMAFQDKAFVSVDKIGIGTTATDTGTSNQTLQNYGSAYISGNLGIGTTNPTTNLQVVGNVGVSGIVTVTTLNVGTGGTIITTLGIGSVGIGTTNPVVNFHVVGNTRFDATTIELNAPTVTVSDQDIILGLGGTITNPTDATASSGGIAVASTEGSPLVDLNIVPLERNPSTYKKFMWFRGSEIGAGVTDAWLSNYAVGIGSTQVPTGTYLAAGNVQFTQNDLAVVRNIKSSGVTTTITLNVGTGGTVITTTGIGSVGIGTANPASRLHIIGGTTSAGTAPLEISAGALLSAVEADVFEYDGVALYHTSNDATNGHKRSVIQECQYFKLNADGPVITATTSGAASTAGGSWFGATNRPSLISGYNYEFTYHCAYTRATTNSGLTFQFTASSGSITDIEAYVLPASGGQVGASTNTGTGTTILTNATGNINAATSGIIAINGIVIPGANMKLNLQVFQTAGGTTTPKKGSWYKFTCVGIGNTIGNIS